MENYDVYEDIAARTGGEIYIGVVGPVRTGKSTFIKRFMEQMVIPYVSGAGKTRMVDELPQSAAGKTVMTTEPKFVPDEAAKVEVRGAQARVRLIDCVGYPAEGAGGFEEDGKPRLVKTPWSDSPMPFDRAAEEGTRRVIREHSTIGILVTTDGSVTDLPRSAYEEGEKKAAEELSRIGKPYLILMNCRRPSETQALCAELEERYGAPVLPLDAENATAEELAEVLGRVLFEFPVVSVDIDIPEWMRALDADTPLISELLAGVRSVAPKIAKMSDCALLDGMFADSEKLLPPVRVTPDLATGKVSCRVEAQEGVFYEVLGEQCGEDIPDDFALMSYVSSLSEAKKLYERVRQAFADAQAYGYGIVSPVGDEMNLADPKVVRMGGQFGVDLKADAPSYHIIRVDINGQVRPTLGNEEQSEAFVRELSQQLQTQPERAWNTNMFGRTLKEMLGEELYVKNRSMAETVQKKMRRTLTRIVNEGKGGVICILL